MHTSDELIEIAKNRGVRVTTRQIGEWHRDGLLPQPTPRTAGRGRPRLAFPDPTPEIVVWLGRYRRTLGSHDDVLVWLWLEGYDQVGVDPVMLQAAVDNWPRLLWDRVRQEHPDLTAIERVTCPPGDAHDDAVSHCIREVVEAPLDARNRTSGTEEAVAVATALFSSYGAGGGLETLSSVLRALRAIDHDGGLPAEPDVQRLVSHSSSGDTTPPIGPALAALNLAQRVRHPIDVRCARACWQVLTSYGGVGGPTPDTAAIVQPFMTFLGTLRRRAYRSDPILIVNVLVAVWPVVWSLLSRDEKRRFGWYKVTTESAARP